MSDHTKGLDPLSLKSRQLNVNLREYDKLTFDRGRSRFVETLWLILDAMFVRSRIPGSSHRRFILRAFGAHIGQRVLFKPGVRIKFPWRLEVADDSWIGEEVWIDNLGVVQIGANCCVSQGAYICTGSHDWTSPAFDLIVRSVKIEDCAWISSHSIVGPGVVVGSGAVLSLGSVATSDLEPWGIYQGAPAALVKRRRSQ